MKKSYLFLAAIASVALVSCSNEEFVGEEIQPTTSNAINFGTSFQAVTRADEYGAAAATKLGNKFVVYGTKHVEAAEDNTKENDAVVFNNFQVAWTENTANTTESNTANWEYVGLQSYNATPTSQGIKYWDFSTVGYTFYAFSSPDITFPAATTDKVSVTKVLEDKPTAPATGSLYNKGYQVTVKPGAQLDKLYFSDRVPVAKANYEKTVSFTFQNIGTKVRFGFYETIPGYSVKIDKFYIDDANSAVVSDFAAMNDAQDDGFYASLQNVKRSADQTLNVTYYDAGDVINQPKLTNPTGGYDYYLKLGSGVINTLGTNSSAPTWTDGTGGYTIVFPFEGNTNPLLLKLDFTMTADDGSGDVIKVRGARAIVPAEYVQWKSNYAYTYIFKISDKSNGTTGAVDANGDPTDDPEGLKPITFDAIVVDATDQTQQTITTVATNSITVTSEGVINDDFSKGKEIAVTITNNATHAALTPSGIGVTAGKAQVYKLSKAASEAEVFAQLTGSSMGITMTAVTAAVDGTKVKFTPSDAGSYAIVYTKTAYVAPAYGSAGDTYDSSKTYYMKTEENVYYAVTVPSAAAFNEHKAKLYLQTAAGTPGVYDIKVIKVNN